MRIKINQIIPDQNQPRKTFNEDSITELGSSFDGLGLIQPITVRPTKDGKYMIIVGERRYRAAQKRGNTDIECTIRKDVDDKTAREMQFAENSQQEDIPPLEMAEALWKHHNLYALTQTELSLSTGLSQRQISRLFSLHIDLDHGLKPMVESGKMDSRAAYEVSRIPDHNLQIKVANAVIDRDLSVDTTAKVVQLIKARPDRPVESIVAQVQYNLETEKANHRHLLNEYKRQQVKPQPIPEGKYKTIIIDPPWSIEKILREVRPNQFDIDYPTMTIDEIMALPVGGLADENGCHIYLWTTHKYLPDAFDILDVWRAKYQCLLTWVKNVGMTPFSWMYSTEHCLFARIGNLDLLKMGKRLDFSGKVREHSRKPNEFYNLVKEVSPEPRIDMFGREKHEGFQVWGDEPDKFKPNVSVGVK